MATHEIRDLPSNSIKGREIPKTEEPKKIEKVVSGEVIVKKTPWYKKAIAAFIGEDVDNVGDYILYDVLIPAFKDTLSDMVSGGMDMLLFGKARGRAVKSRNGTVDYNGVSRKSRDRQHTIRSRRSIDSVVIPSRSEAEEVMDRMMDLYETYGVVSAADFYDLVGVTNEFTDNKYGWDNLAGMRLRRVPDGYLIDLPDPIDFN